MALLLVIAAAAAAAVVILILLQTRQKPQPNTPPGPRPLPVIGNLHQLGPIAHHSLHRLSKLYGPIFRLHLGRVPALVISSPSLAEQVLKTHDLAFCSRPPIVSFQHYSYNGCDVAAAAYGEPWRNLRKIFVLELLAPKKLPLFTSVREEETGRMIRSIKPARADENSAVDVKEIAVRLGHNVIFRVAFGYMSEGEYGEKSRFQTMLEASSDTVASFYASDYFPWLGRVVDELTGQMRRLRRSAREFDEFYQEVIDAHLRGEGREDDVVDALLRLWKDGQLTMDHIKGALMNIFVAGTDTSSATITWAMAELARNPGAMRKAQDEVRGAVGEKGVVEESDLDQLRYLRWVVNETLRLHPPVPLLIPRETMERCVVDGYIVGAKTRVFVNAWAIGRDEEAWEGAEEFRPERFSGSSVEYKGHHFQFLPFGAGRRVCPGVQFGASTVELALANLLYAFDWELPAGVERGDFDMYEAPGLVTHKKAPLILVASNYQHAG